MDQVAWQHKALLDLYFVVRYYGIRHTDNTQRLRLCIAEHCEVPSWGKNELARRTLKFEMNCVLYINIKLYKLQHQWRSFLNFPSEPLKPFYTVAMNYGAHIVNIWSQYLPRNVLSNRPHREVVGLIASTLGRSSV